MITKNPNGVGFAWERPTFKIGCWWDRRSIGAMVMFDHAGGTAYSIRLRIGWPFFRIDTLRNYKAGFL